MNVTRSAVIAAARTAIFFAYIALATFVVLSFTPLSGHLPWVMLPIATALNFAGNLLTDRRAARR